MNSIGDGSRARNTDGVAPMSRGCASGLHEVGELPWGSHVCHFYQTRADLVETAVSFLAAGLENNEQCFWVTSEPLETEEATWELAQRVDGLQSKIERGQIRIVGYSDWYGRKGRLDVDSLLGELVAAEQSARAAGYVGMRTLGSSNFLKLREQWGEFQRYESRVSEVIAGRRLIALCGYDLERCGATDLLDVLRHHDCAMVRCNGEAEVLEKPARNRRGTSVCRAYVALGGASLEGQLETSARERAEFEQALDQQAAAARAKDEFLAMLSHELRNPLAPMMTALELMKLRGLESREQEIMARQVSHLTRLVDDLLDVSRIAQGRIELKTRRIEWSEVVIRAIEVVSPMIEQRQQRLDVRVPCEGLLIDADLERMAQVLGNLLTNASKYSDARSRILVTASREGTALRCSVRDEGMGIAPEMLNEVFGLFVQQPQALGRSGGGLGLGLAIVRSLVEQHGGTVRATSEGVGLGSEFIIELPAAQGGENGP